MHTMETAAEATTADPPVLPSVLASDEVSDKSTPETGRTALARFATEVFFMAAKARVDVLILIVCTVYL